VRPSAGAVRYLDDDGPLDQQVVVFSRHITNDPSAAHLARSAMAHARRGEPVTVVLIGPSVMAGAGRSRVAELLSAGVTVAMLEPIMGPSAARLRVGLPLMQEDTLARLLLRPGVHSQWC
jgi:hypothetical protein